jgi:hypothetical protein
MTRAMQQPPRPRTPVPPGTPPAPPGQSEPPAPERRGRLYTWQMVAVIVSGLLVLAAGLYVATRKPATPTNPGNAAAGPVHSVAGNLNGRQEAQLEVLDGAESVTIHNEELGDLLFRATTVPGSKVEPTVSDEGALIKLGLTNTSVAGQAAVHIYLNSKVRWQLKLAGGGLEQSVDFVGGRLASLEIAAGTGRIDLALPKPEGTVAVKLPAGAGQLAIHLQPGVPAQLTFGTGSGAGTVTVDGKTQQGVQAGAVLTPDGWAQAKDRYDVQAAGGFATVTVDHLGARGGTS